MPYCSNTELIAEAIQYGRKSRSKRLETVFKLHTNRPELRKSRSKICKNRPKLPI